MSKEFNRFQFEQDLLNTWTQVNAIDDIADSLGANEVCVEHAVVALRGLSVLLDLRFDCLMKQFEKSLLKSD